MNYFAAAAATAATPMERLKAIPPAFWMKVGIGVAIFIGAVILLRKIAAMNKVILGVVAFVIVVVVGFNWVYERTEPAFLTPLVNKIAPFLPTKGSYGDKQKTTPKI